MRRGMHGLCFAALWLLADAAAATADVVVHDAWIAEAPPGAMAAAAFMVLENRGAEPRSAVRAESPACERIEFHRSEMEGGIARMLEQKSLTVPAGGSLALEPGATHMMLIRPAALRAGDRVQITLELDDGEKLEVEAVVRKRARHAH
jgi:copper(I)-binding protein